MIIAMFNVLSGSTDYPSGITGGYYCWFCFDVIPITI